MSPEFKSIAIVGAGAIGTYYGACLQRAGFDVRFLMRSDLSAVRERGTVVLRETSGETSVGPIAAFGSSAEIGVVDLVLVALKTTSNADLKAILPPLVGPTTTVATLQNGLGNEDFLATFLDPKAIVGGLCFIGVTRTGPGELKGYQTPGYITLGELSGPATERTRALAAAFVKAGVKCRAVDRLIEARWTKLVWNIPFNGLSIAAGGITTDKILEDPVMAREVRALMYEVLAAAAGEGCVVPEALIQNHIENTPAIGAYQPSSLIDYLAGREVEIESIWAEPLRRAQAHGVATPRLALLYAILKTLCRH